jgi:S1-C subfamily serine protease
MKKTFLAVLTALSLGLTAFVPASMAQSARVLAPDFADLVEKASPAVVNIRTTEQRAAHPNKRKVDFPLVFRKSRQSFFAASLAYRLRAPLNRDHRSRGNHAKQSVVLARVSLLTPMAWF